MPEDEWKKLHWRQKVKIAGHFKWGFKIYKLAESYKVSSLEIEDAIRWVMKRKKK